MSLTTQQIAQLTRLQNGPTRYEIMVTRADGATALLCYAARHSKRGLLSAILERRPAAVAFLGATPMLDWSKSINGFMLSGGGSIRFTGRTQREAIQADGVRPTVTTLLAQAAQAAP